MTQVRKFLKKGKSIRITEINLRARRNGVATIKGIRNLILTGEYPAEASGSAASQGNGNFLGRINESNQGEGIENGKRS